MKCLNKLLKNPDASIRDKIKFIAKDTTENNNYDAFLRKIMNSAHVV